MVSLVLSDLSRSQPHLFNDENSNNSNYRSSRKETYSTQFINTTCCTEDEEEEEEEGNEAASDQQREESTGTIPLFNHHNRMYSGPISFGLPPQLFSVVFDTGSADIWILTSAVQPKQPYLHYYEPEKSTTFKEIRGEGGERIQWKIQYGKGNAMGFLALETIQIANYTVRDQIWAYTTYVAPAIQLKELPLDGIVGLAFSQVSNSKSKQLLDNLYEQGQISRRMFGFHLKRDGNEDGGGGETEMWKEKENGNERGREENSYDQQGSFLVIGEAALQLPSDVQYNNNRYRSRAESSRNKAILPTDETPSPDTCTALITSSTSTSSSSTSTSSPSSVFPPSSSSSASSSSFSSDLIWFNLIPHTGMWLLFLHHISIDNQIITNCRTRTSFTSSSRSDSPSISTCVVLFDSGTSFISLPRRIYSHFVSLLTSSRPDCVPSSFSSTGLLICSERRTDDLPSFEIAIGEERFILEGWQYMIGNVVGVMPFDTETTVGTRGEERRDREKVVVDVFILGDTFLQNYYTVFDMDERRIGVRRYKMDQTPMWSGDGRGSGRGGGEEWMGWILAVAVVSALVLLH